MAGRADRRSSGEATSCWDLYEHGPRPSRGAAPDPLEERGLPAAALASVGTAVVVTEPDGTIVWVNDAFTTMSGYRADEVVGDTPELFGSGVRGQPSDTQLWATIRERRVWRGERVERHRDGHLFTVMQTITPILDDEGEITHLVAVHEDVSQLRASQARLQALFDHALDGILLFDDEGRVVDANPAVSELTGCASDELTTMCLVDFVPDADRERFEAAWTRLETKGRVRGTSPILRPDGGRVDIEFQAVAGIADGVNLLTARDVTARRRAESQQRFQAQLLEAVGDAVIASDLEGRVRYVNPTAERLFGWTERQVLGRPAVEVTVPPEAVEGADEILAKVRAGETWTGELELQRRDGTTFPALVTNAPYLDEAGELAGIIGVATDIGDLHRTQRLLARRIEQQAVIAELGQWALATEDPVAVGARARAQAAQMLGPEVTVELVWHTEPPGRHDPDDAVRIEIGTVGSLVLGGPGAVDLDPEDVEFARALAHLVHASVQQHTASSQLEHLATHDPLTGLINRTLFLDRIEHTRDAARRSGENFAVLLLDLDGFKSVNDGLSHKTGDEVLRLVAERLRSAVRPGDTIARFGGDEFAVLCPGVVDEAAPLSVAKRISTALNDGVDTEHGPLAITASIGVVLGDHEPDGPSLLRNADTAMYSAKNAGRNRVELFDTHMQETAEHRYRMARTLREALDTGGVAVLYQPSIDLSTGRITGVEALARLRRPEGGLVPPNEFIWVAEETGLIGELGQQVLRQACGDAREWIAEDPAFMLAVNLSPRQLTHHELAETVEAALADTGIGADSLWLEITESALLSSPDVPTAMNQLRRSGIRFAIDDFGTGYSSLAHLRRMPVDMLKIDRSFVSGIHANIQDHALVAATLDLARTFELCTTAEGVETPEQLTELTDLGCDIAQGYLWSPPVDAGAITAMLRDGARGPRPTEAPQPRA